MPKHNDHHGGKAGIFGLGVGVLSFGAVASAIAGTHKILETAVQLRNLWDVSEDNMVFVRIIDRVHVDLKEVERLMALPEIKDALRKTPAKVDWIRETIGSVKEALETTAHFTKRVRKDTDRGKWVGLRNRIWFRMEEFEKLELHTLEIARCHDGLLAVLSLLSSYEMGEKQEEPGYDRRYQQQEQEPKYETVGYGQTFRDDRREINYRAPRDDFADVGDTIYTKEGDGPGYSAEIAVDRYDGQQLQGRYAERGHYGAADDEGYVSEDRRAEYGGRQGEHVREVEVDRIVERDDGRRVAAHYEERRIDDRHSGRDYRDDDQHIDVKRRAEVRRHGGQVEVDGYEERDDGQRVEAHYVERREDDRYERRSHRGREERDDYREDRYIDLNRRAEVRRRHHDGDDHGHRERVSMNYSFVN
jgi:hypothetical protein